MQEAQPMRQLKSSQQEKKSWHFNVCSLCTTFAQKMSVSSHYKVQQEHVVNLQSMFRIWSIQGVTTNLYSDQTKPIQ